MPASFIRVSDSEDEHDSIVGLWQFKFVGFGPVSTSVVPGQSFTFWTIGAISWNARKLLIAIWKFDDLRRGRKIAPPQMLC